MNFVVKTDLCRGNLRIWQSKLALLILKYNWILLDDACFVLNQINFAEICIKVEPLETGLKRTLNYLGFGMLPKLIKSFN